MFLFSGENTWKNFQKHTFQDVLIELFQYKCVALVIYAVNIIFCCLLGHLWRIFVSVWAASVLRT
jgi:hypothetical protein